MTKQISLLLLALLSCLSMLAGEGMTQVIAHRGAWQGTAQNSRESLLKALALDIYGSETDVWLTADGHLVVNHDADYGGIVIKDATAADCRALVLANGENIPELSDFLEIMASSASPTKLIIEIKDHDSAALNKRAATAAVELVRQYDVASKVEYISFSTDACEQIVAEEPAAKVAYLAGGVSPSALHDKGYTGIDYHMDEFRSHPEWVAEAHQAGMTANVWTINDAEDIAIMVNLNVDYITTDIPIEASALISEMHQ